MVLRHLVIILLRSEVTTKSTEERDNPLYESQELTIEMFQETAGTSDEEDREPMYESQVSHSKSLPLVVPSFTHSSGH